VLVLQGLFVRIAPLSSSEAPKIDRARVAQLARVPGSRAFRRDFTVYRRDARAAAALVPGDRPRSSIDNYQLISVAHAVMALIPPVIE
jgi:hypothetical protein